MRDHIHCQYVDNYVAISQKPGSTKELAELMEEALNLHGLPTPDVEAAQGLETLGWLFTAGRPVCGSHSQEDVEAAFGSFEVGGGWTRFWATVSWKSSWVTSLLLDSSNVFVGIPGLLRVHAKTL